MANLFKPTWFFKDYRALQPDFLRQQGIKLVISDIDNTLLGWDASLVPDDLLTWVGTLKEEGIDLCLLSNNNETRIAKVAESLQVPYVFPGLKPLKRGYKAALALYPQWKPDQCLMLGDQLMTDVLGANRCSLKSALVKPIKPSDGWNTRINRFFEANILRLQYGKKLEQLWEGNEWKN